MNKKRDYYYKILGLRPGATPSEIKSAYRRLVKFYHPDRDQSADSETMYREIYTAYKALSEQPSASETGTGQVIYRYHPEWSTETSNQAKKTSQSTAGSNNSSKRTTSDSKEYEDWVNKVLWDSEDWEYKEETTFEETTFEKIPFEMDNLLSIFWVSLKEMYTEKSFLTKVIPVLFSTFTVLHIYFESLLSSAQQNYVLAALFHIVLWIAVIIFRYYYVHYAPLTLKGLIFLLAVFIQGSILFLLTACFYSVQMEELSLACILSAVPVWLMLLEPTRIKSWKRRSH